MELNQGTNPTSDLFGYVHDILFARFKKNRATVEDRWNRNRAAFERNGTLDPKGTWKTSEKSEPWMSDTFVDIITQKVRAGQALVVDTMFKGNRVAFMLK